MKKLACAALMVLMAIGYSASISAEPQPVSSPSPYLTPSALDALLADVFKTAGQEKWSSMGDSPFSSSDVLWGSCSQTCPSGSSSSKTCPDGYTCSCWCDSDGNAECGSCN